MSSGRLICVTVFLTLAFFPTSISRLIEEFSCDFERDFCEWSKPEWSRYRWSRTKYKSILPLSGPTAAYEKDYYIFFNNTFLSRDSEAYLQSIPSSEKLTKPCLRFYYHMYGSTMGQLELGLLRNNQQDQESVLWQIDGDQSNVWHCGLTDIGSIAPGDSIFIKAVSGLDKYSIIAIDNIQLFTNVKSCASECENLEESILTPDSTKRIITTTSEFSTTQENALEIATYPPWQLSLKWTVGVPSAIIVFGVALAIITVLIRRKERIRRLKKIRQSELNPLSRMMQIELLRRNHSAPRIEDRYSAKEAPTSVYSEIREVNVNEHIYMKPVVNNSTDNLSKSSVHEYDYVVQEPKCTNGQIVQCEINHHNSASITNISDLPMTSTAQADEEDYVTLSQ